MKTEELMKRMDQLKEQQKIIEKKKLDSIAPSKPTPDKGAIRPIEPNSVAKEVFRQLQNENLINNVKDLSFKLANDQLTVKEVKQTGEVLPALKSSIIKNPTDHIIYNVIKNSSHPNIAPTTIDK